MASYSSTQSGVWNDPDTWGGGGYPSVAGDTATINSGHTVTYNHQNSAALGNVDIYGTLQFTGSANPEMRLGNSVMRVYNNGKLLVGSAASPVPIGNTVKIEWELSSDDAGNLTVENGGQCLIYGSSRSDTLAELINDAENTDSDNVLIVGGAVDWAVNDLVVIHRRSAYSNYASDGVVAQIVGVSAVGGNTQITLDQSVAVDGGVGSSWPGRVWNITRSVVLGRYYSTYPSIGSGAWTKCPSVHAKALSSGVTVFSRCLFAGVHALYHDAASPVTNGVDIAGSVVFGRYGPYYAKEVADDADTLYVSLYYGRYEDTVSARNGINGSFICCYMGMVFSPSSRVAGLFVGCKNAFYAVNDFLATGEVCACRYIAPYCRDGRFECDYIWGSETIALDGGPIYCSSNIGRTKYGDKATIYPVLRGALVVECSEAPLFSGSDLFAGEPTASAVRYEDYNQAVPDQQTKHVHGDITVVDADGVGTRPNGGPNGQVGRVLEMVPTSAKGDLLELPAFPISGCRLLLGGGTRTITFKVQSTFSGVLDASDAFLRVARWDSTTNRKRSLESTSTIAPRADNRDWTQSLSVTFSHKGATWVDVQIFLRKYESGGYLYVWPEAEAA